MPPFSERKKPLTEHPDGRVEKLAAA